MTEEAKIEEENMEATPDLGRGPSLKKGDAVKGKIIKVEDEQAIVDIGYKYDGVIPLKELSSVPLENAAEAVQVGQEVELKVVSFNDEKATLVLSKRAVDREAAWDKLQSAMGNNEILEAKVADVVKGGLVVDVGLRGFIPASMVERTFVEDFSDYKGRTLRLKVKELDREKNKVILSQKDVLDEEFELKKKQIVAGLQVGQEIEGTIQRLTPFGVFVDIGGIDGLVHVSEMAWHHVEQPSDMVKEGEQVKVKIIKLDPQQERISLSMKAVQPGPWETTAGKFNVGGIVTGTVKRLVSFGAFVEIAPGVEGLVHISQIAHRHIATPHEVLKEGQEIQAKVLDFNPAEKRVSLSIKETEEAPAPAPRPEKTKVEKVVIDNDNTGLSFTLGERFGEQLSKFKK